MEHLQTIRDIIKNYSPINLAQLDTIPMADRQDTKAFFHIHLLPTLLEELTPYYYILEVEGERLFRYQSIYYDTPSFQLYHDHHNGRLKRNKIRYRLYVDSGVTFFEIKTKTNKGRNLKKRFRVEDLEEQLCEKCKELVSKSTNIDPDSLVRSLTVSLYRITMVGKDYSEKATIDINIRFKYNGHTEDTNGLIISEVKQNKYNSKSRFLNIQRDLKIYPNNISKYCLGMVSSTRNVRHNRMKPKLLKIQKVIKGFSRTGSIELPVSL